MIDVKDIDAIIGADVVDSANDRIGRVSQVYIDSEDQHPSWVSVRTGFFGRSETLIPIDDASWDDSLLHVSVDRAKVREAPHVDPDQELSVEEQNALYRYYGKGGDDPVDGDAVEPAPGGAEDTGSATDGSIADDAEADDSAARATAAQDGAVEGADSSTDSAASSDEPEAGSADRPEEPSAADDAGEDDADGSGRTDQPVPAAADRAVPDQAAEEQAAPDAEAAPASVDQEDGADAAAADPVEPSRTGRRGRRRSNFVDPDASTVGESSDDPSDEAPGTEPAPDPEPVGHADPVAETTTGTDAAPGAANERAADASEEEHVSDQSTQTAAPAAETGSLAPQADAADPDVITRYEERLRVGTELVPSARMRLVKTIVTEHRTVTVPVSHEEIRLEREPIGEDEIANWSGPTSELQEEEREIILMAERPVVSTHTAPIERIRLVREVIQENRDVEADLRHEQVDLNHDGIPDDQQ